MRNFLLICTALILSITVTQFVYAGGDEEEPTTICGYLKQMSRDMKTLESSINSRIDDLNCRLNVMEGTLSGIKKEVDGLKRNIGGFEDVDCPRKEFSKDEQVCEPSETINFVLVKCLKPVTLPSLDYRIYSGIDLGTVGQFTFVREEVARFLVDKGAAEIVGHERYPFTRNKTPNRDLELIQILIVKTPGNFEHNNLRVRDDLLKINFSLSQKHFVDRETANFLISAGYAKEIKDDCRNVVDNDGFSYEKIPRRDKEIVLVSNDGEEVPFPSNFDRLTVKVKELLEQSGELDRKKVRKVGVSLTGEQLYKLKSYLNNNGMLNTLFLYTAPLQERNALNEIANLLEYKTLINELKKYKNKLFVYASSSSILYEPSVPEHWNVEKENGGYVLEPGKYYEVSFEDEQSLEFVRQMLLRSLLQFAPPPRK